MTAAPPITRADIARAYVDRRMPAILQVARDCWGIESLRPLQREAIEAEIACRDSLVVMPTGGGKSLCFQAPAVAREGGLTVVVSPLIALMRDQVSPA